MTDSQIITERLVKADQLQRACTLEEAMRAIEEILNWNGGQGWSDWNFAAATGEWPC